MVLVGGVSRILQGVFGVASLRNPTSGLVNQQVHQVGSKPGGPYQFHETALFTPGTGNWAFNPSNDSPVNTAWGHAFLRLPNGFNPIQSPQVYTAAASTMNGIGGQVAGQLINQPLSDNQELGAQ